MQKCGVGRSGIGNVGGRNKAVLLLLLQRAGSKQETRRVPDAIAVGVGFALQRTEI